MPGLTLQRLLKVTFAGVLLAAGLPALAEDSVHHWLDRMSRAVETLDYRGTLVHVRNGEVDTLKIVHRADEEGVRERIVSIDGEPREILRRGDNVRCILPGDEPLMLESQLNGRLFPALPVNRLLGPDSTYRMSLGSRERVAGMSAQIIHIQPRDAYRYGARLWLEEKTGMLLRYALIDHDDRQLQQVSFTSLELGASISDSELEPELSGAESDALVTNQTLRSSGAAVDRRASTSPRVPRGYRLINAGKGQSASGGEFEHLLYSDGLSSFSIYVEHDESDAMVGRVDSMGPVHVYTMRSDGRLFTVVGEVPSATVEFVGRQLRRSGRERSRH